MDEEICFRDDDVLQNSLFTDQQKKAFRNGMNYFKHFLEADKLFEKYNYPCILSVCSEGIDQLPEWAEYIKKNLHRYKIELHGSKHFVYSDLTEEQGYKDLSEAKNKIEDYFGVKITEWFIPFNRRHYPEWAERVCEKIGIKTDIHRSKHDGDLWLKNYYHKGEIPFTHINFHFWVPTQRQEVEEILKIICEGE